jgi:hypothetical protein
VPRPFILAILQGRRRILIAAPIKEVASGQAAVLERQPAALEFLGCSRHLKAF